ncbi:glycosyl hydrolase family 28-related protein [Halpernia sp. GG3]
MKKPLIFVSLNLGLFFQSQVINLKTYIMDEGSNTLKKAISDIKRDYSSQKKHVVLFIPAGTYTLSEPIVLNKYISLEGEAENSTVLQVKNPNQEAIILEDNKNEIDINNTYNTIRNLTITGPDFNKNPFEWKDLKQNNTRSVGIKILGLRNRINNCTIAGFLWSGIEISSSYYNFITYSFIKNNRIGITIDKNSTSTYFNNNELRTNAIGILIQNNSYANFINNNMIENNIGNMLAISENDDDPTILTKGNGIIINNAMNNFIQNNYFEQQVNNIFLNNANDNEISSNFFALNILDNKAQNILKIAGNSKNNSITRNSTMGSKPEVDVTKMIFLGKNDYSTNTIDFGKEKNEEIKGKLRNNKNLKRMPDLP